MPDTFCKRIRAAIERMACEYGPQGWWPIASEVQRFAPSNDPRRLEGYHPGEFDFPQTIAGRFEICCGAVLTQNTAWTNVRHALEGLLVANALSAKRLLLLPEEQLASVIRPAGYFNQKASYLRAVALWFQANDARLVRSERSLLALETARPILLKVRGVGPETADAILLYAYRLPTFVVDAYTMRVFGRLNVVDSRSSYEAVRSLLGDALRQRTLERTVEYYQEAHALIVEHAKRHHGRKSDATKDFLLD